MGCKNPLQMVGLWFMALSLPSLPHYSKKIVPFVRPSSVHPFPKIWFCLSLGGYRICQNDNLFDGAGVMTNWSWEFPNVETTPLCQFWFELPQRQLRIRSWNLPWLGTYSHHVSGFTGVEAQGSVTPLEIVHQRPPDVAPHISTLQPQTTVRTSGIPTWMTRSHSTKLGLMPSSPSINEAAASLIAIHWSSFSFTCKVWMLDSFDVRWCGKAKKAPWSSLSTALEHKLTPFFCETLEPWRWKYPEWIE